MERKLNNQVINSRNNFKAVIFDLDGTLYQGQWIAFRLIIKNIFHYKFLHKLINIRRKLRGIDFKSKEKLYNEIFNKMSVSLKKPNKIQVFVYNKILELSPKIGNYLLFFILSLFRGMAKKRTI